MAGDTQNDSPASPDEVQGPDSTVPPASADVRDLVQTPQSPRTKLDDDVSGSSSSGCHPPFAMRWYQSTDTNYFNFLEQEHETTPSWISTSPIISETSMTPPPYATDPASTIPSATITDTLPVNDQPPISETASNSKTYVSVPWPIQHPSTVPPFSASTINATPSTSTVSSLLVMAGSSSTNNKAARRRQARKNNIPKCKVCLMSYGRVVHQQKSEMMVTRCGHLVCQLCVDNMLADHLRDCPGCHKHNAVRYSKLRILFL